MYTHAVQPEPSSESTGVVLGSTRGQTSRSESARAGDPPFRDMDVIKLVMDLERDESLLAGELASKA